jgi:hypothetical protein
VTLRAVPHISAPERKGVHRVKEYWSVMQVQAVKGLSEVFSRGLNRISFFNSLCSLY